MKFSRTLIYALQAMLQIAEAGQDKPIPCSRLAAEGHLPGRFLLHILGRMVAKGILASTRGADGGYMLVRSADDISLLEVIEAVEGPLTPALPTNGTPLADTLERLHSSLSAASAVTRRELDAIKLTDLLPAR
jgi:Rrf2 family protein